MNTVLAAAAASAFIASSSFAGGILGPYLSEADSPFAAVTFSRFELENFEDGALNTLGVTLASPGTAITFPGLQTDSVDADDGAIDGSGIAGRSLIALTTNVLRFEFDAMALGGLPTHVGIVWTDVGITATGVGSGTVNFRVYDAGGLVGDITSLLGDGDTFGGTAEDRFFGAVVSTGVTAIEIEMPDSQDWEVDHLQYGIEVPAPAAALLLSGAAGLVVIPRRRRV
ncbi:MAG: hypothetical protein SFZ24_04885 [Planctomycetota bacterium]|nr:hypothetical protein [Planctomycetota bacterium]